MANIRTIFLFVSQLAIVFLVCANCTTISKYEWGKADWLEPVTNSPGQPGTGGATQAVTKKGMPGVLEVEDLETGEILYMRRE